MSTATIFNLEMKKYLLTDKGKISSFIRDKFNESKHETFNRFFDDFLFRYGIISFNSIPVERINKYIPYINCDEKNVFREMKGITDLSAKPCTINECQRIFVEYFKLKFNRLELKVLEEWKTEE